MWKILFLLTMGVSCVLTTTTTEEMDDESSRKILGSSVVTSVSVIMDTGNGSKAVFSDAVGKPMGKPTNSGELASPINLLNPDRYEFYTFDDNGELVKRLMSLEEIQSIIATGDGDGFNFDTFTSEGYMPEKRVNDIVNNVQNVLKEEMETHKVDAMDTKPMFDTPDVSDSWSMILPAIFGNSGEDIKPEKPITHVTPDTIMIEPNAQTPLSGIRDKLTAATAEVSLYTRSTTARSTTVRSTTPAPKTPISLTSSQISTTEKLATNKINTTSVPVFNSTKTKPMINVEVYSNSKSTTEKNLQKEPSNLVVEIKPASSTKMPTTVSTTTRRSTTTTRPTSTTSRPTTTARTTTTTTTTTAAPTTTVPKTTTEDIPQYSLPTLYQLLHQPQNYLTTLKKEGITEAPMGGLTTFTLIDGIRTKPEITTESEYPSTENLKEINDLITLSTEYTTLKNQNVQSTTIQDYTTTQLPLEESLSTAEKISASSLLDQLLLTSTNIYEINTELTKKQTTIMENLLKTTNPTTTEEIISSTTTNPTTTGDDRFLIKIDESTEQSTLAPSLLNSIEQLLSQAVTNVEDGVVNVNDSLKVENMMLNSSKKNMTDIQMETATIASSMIANNLQESTTVASDKMDESSLLLSDSVGSIISQVYGTSESDLTTIESITEQITTEKPRTTTNIKTTAISNRKTDDDENIMDAKSTEVADSTSNSPQITDKYEEISLDNETTTEFENITDKDNYVPHLINITIISTENKKNQSLPETNYTLISTEKHVVNMNTRNEILKTAASSSLSVNNVEDSLTSTETSTMVTETITNLPTTTLLPTTTSEPTTQTPEELFDFTTEVSNVETTLNSLKKVPEESNMEKDLSVRSTSPKPTMESASNENSTNIKRYTTPANDVNSGWTLVSTVSPHSPPNFVRLNDTHPINSIVDPPSPVDLVPKPLQGFGLEDSTARLDTDIYQFTQLCNELAFGFWKSVTTSISSARSVVISPFSATSLLAMVFLGARGATSGEMNEILRLDDMVTFNPHLIFKNISESIRPEEPDSGIATSAIIRELFSDKSKGRVLGFYKERVRQFYDGLVEEASFREIGDTIRRRTNLLVKKQTNGKITDFLKDASIKVKAPLAAVGVNIFQTDCSQASTEGRDGELHFVVLPSIRQRRLIPIPATVWRSGFLAGYEPSLDATAVALGTKDHTISTIFVIPGQQGIAAPGDGLARLEKRLVESSFKKGAWSRLLRSLIPRPGLEVQIPRFSHKSIINATLALKKMGLKDLFDSDKADLRGLNGVANELHLSDMLQVNNFVTCGEGRIGEQHHSEMYPATTLMARNSRLLQNYDAIDTDLMAEPRDYQRAFHDPSHDPSYLSLPLQLRPRQARVPDAPRLRFDRPFLYFVRHNPTGLILHMGRFNPRLLP